MSEQSIHYGQSPDHFNPVGTRPLTPKQIADYVHQEFTPYASMDLAEAKKHLAELIERYAQMKVQEYKNRYELP
jgi:peptidyl-tRNA hydrolase